MAVLLIVGACGGTQSPAEPARRAQIGEPEPDADDSSKLVHFELVADTTRVAKDQEIAIAAHFRMEPGWHIYWSNPGDSGLPTQVSVDSDAAVEVGALRYPAPRRFDLEGGIVNYGYEDAAVLPMSLVVGDVSNSVVLRGKATWLGCREEACVPGAGEATLTLPLATAEEPSAPANAELFESASSRLPVAFAELGARVSVQPTEGGSRVSIQVADSDRLELFPLDDQRVTGIMTLGGEGGARVEMTVAPSASGDLAVLAVHGSVPTRYFQIASSDIQSQGESR